MRGRLSGLIWRHYFRIARHRPRIRNQPVQVREYYRYLRQERIIKARDSAMLAI
jgi:hypothetical protein